VKATISVPVSVLRKIRNSSQQWHPNTRELPLSSVSFLSLHHPTLKLTTLRCRSRRRSLSSTACQSRILGHSPRKEFIHWRPLQLNPPRRIQIRPRPLTSPPPQALQRNIPRPRHLARSRRRAAPQMRTELQPLVRRWREL
jgi:hypothetical protein